MSNTNPKNIRNNQMGSIRNIHFVGIGGVGMCGIAEVLHTQGYSISGSDIKPSAITERLESLGVDVFFGHSSDNILNADVVVVSSAIDSENPELKAAHKLLIPVITRAQMLGEIMRFRYSIAVSGTHGKTTTTSLISTILSQAGVDPTYVIGGKVNGGDNARLGSSEYMVVEADESDVSFLDLKPMTAVVTNIDADHMENYNDDFETLKVSFHSFLKLLPFYGQAVICIEDQVTKELAQKAPCRTVTYGFSKDADLCAINCKSDGMQTSFTLLRKSKPSLDLTINIPGKHNILNVMGAIGAISHLGISDEAIVASLANFQGVKRRFNKLGEFKLPNGSFTLVDDYGHHPTEIAANINAVRSVWPDARIVMLFQPHRYSRLSSLMQDFIDTLAKVDVLLLLDVYSAGEQEIPGANSEVLINKLADTNVQALMLKSADDYAQQILPSLQPGDILVTQGAGSIGAISANLASSLPKTTY